MVNFFPPEHALHIRQQLSSCLVGILFQTLVQNKQGGRVVATELLLNNSAMKNLIREGKYNHMGNVLQTGRTLGMHTLHDSIKELCEKGLIDNEDAASFAKANPS
jgi:twitching motility protein PilT